MDTATEELYFQKIQEFVFDDDQIVTVPSLAKTLEIPVQESQLLIVKFAEDQQKLKPGQLTLTYILSGYIKNENNKVVMMVTKSNLEKKRSCFAEILTEVIFSVQKCPFVNFQSLFLVDKPTSCTSKPLLGLIVGDNCVESDKKIKDLPSPQPSAIKGKSSFFLPKNGSTTIPVKESQSSNSSEAKSSGSIADMFSRASTSKAENKEKSKTPKKSDNKPKGGLSGFLSKSPTKQTSNKSTTNSDSSMRTSPNISREQLDINVNDEVENKGKDASKTIRNNETRNTKKETKGKRNKRQRDKSEEKSTKRRKRIVERDDSESDDMFENDNEDIIEKSEDEPDRISSPVESKPQLPKNKIRKAVDKTYEDEEGFIVTKTEYVYESAPEDDENVISVKSEKDNIKDKQIEKKSVTSEKVIKSKKGKKTNQNQPTLMNFFMKK